MLRANTGLALVCAFALTAGTAEAKVMSATFVGELSGYDAIGFLGDRTFYDAQPFVAQLTYDTALGYRTDFNGTGEFLGGGQGGGYESPILSAILTVGGQATDLTHTFNSTAETYGPNYVHEFADRYPGQVEFNVTDVQSAVPLPSFFNFWIGGFGAAQASLETPWSGPLTGGYGALEGGFAQAGSPALFAFSLTPSSVRFEAVSASPTPEPGVWGLMLLGFGAVGAALRRRSPRPTRRAQALEPASRQGAVSALRRPIFAAASVTAASLLAGSAQAATIVQSQAFSIFHVVNHAASGAGIELPDEPFGGVERQTLLFQGFDTALGSLRGVRLDLNSQLTLSYGVFINPVGSVWIEGSMVDDVLAAGHAMGRLSRDVFISCGTVGAAGCLLTETKSADFDLAGASAPLAPFLQGGPVPVELASNLNLTLVLSRLFGDARATTTQSWAGEVQLSYDYDPTPLAVPVPEPETWALAVLGFGLAGAAMRSRRQAWSPIARG